MPACTHCGKVPSFFSGLILLSDNQTSVCSECYDKYILVSEEEKKRKKEEKKRHHEKILKDSESLIVTTTHKVDGFYAEKYIGIETVEYVIGTGVFSELSTALEDFVGARSSAFESKLRKAKNQALNTLKYMAAEQGANAVIGVDIDYSEFSGNRIAVIVNGTLVKLKPIRSESSRAEK